MMSTTETMMKNMKDNVPSVVENESSVAQDWADWEDQNYGNEFPGYEEGEISNDYAPAPEDESEADAWLNEDQSLDE